MKNHKVQVIHDTIRVAIDSLPAQNHSFRHMLGTFWNSLQIPEWLTVLLWIVGVVAGIVAAAFLVSFAVGVLRACFLFVVNFIKSGSNFLFIITSELVMYLWQHIDFGLEKMKVSAREARNSRTLALRVEIAKLEGERQAQEELTVLEAKNKVINKIILEKLDQSVRKSQLDFTEDEIKNLKTFAVHMDTITLEEWKVLYLKDSNGYSFDAFVSKNLARLAMSQTFTGGFEPSNV